MSHLPENALDVAHHLADAARHAILPHFRSLSLTEESKASDGYDPVTIADRAAEEAMRKVLKESRPEDGIFGEEFGKTSGQSGWTWVLDPIDGTRGFVAGTPTWGVLIALSDYIGPKLGVIDQPYIQERFIGAEGSASLVGPHGYQRLKTRGARPLEDAVLLTTFPEVGTENERLGFEAVARKVKLVRYGMDCYGYALIAAGQVDLVIEAGLQPYDIQAPMALVEAAGGVVTDWDGGPAYEGGRVVAAANAEIHSAALALLTQTP